MASFIISLDENRCVGCHACETACKMNKDLPVGPRLIKVQSIEFFEAGGEVWRFNSRPIRCVHCDASPCLRVCPTRAISKARGINITMVDQEKCIGCKLCLLVCPFSAPQFNSRQRMLKCDLCFDYLEMGQQPVCVSSCPVGALRLEERSTYAREVRGRYLKKITTATKT